MPLTEKLSIEDRVSNLVSSYGSLPGVSDELFDQAGNIRPVWKPFIDAIAGFGTDELAERKERGDQYLRDAGVFYRQYGSEDSTEREWPLSHLPVLIDELEWQQIEAGLKQRADLLERIVADFYGENRLVKEGFIPPELLADNKEWLRSLIGVRPRGGNFLHFVAFDIGRGPEGQWWVISDRTQAPSGAGFALENRIATARIYADFYAKSSIHRLAGFFRKFRDALQELQESQDSRVAILTPGPLNDTYFEHAYIARYLGFNLLEGEDLTIRNGALMVRTVAGLRPVSVLWRRLDANWVDPLELDNSSRLGTPGMLQAVRSAKVTMVNALGSGVLESRALLAFLPRISKALTGEKLSMPNIATWWCGQSREREYVKGNAQRMTIGNAFATRSFFELDDLSAVGGEFNRDFSETLEGWIDRNGSHLVAQEAITLSTTPAFDGDKIVPRPMSLRVFLARTPNGWEIMPGGFARIGKTADSSALAMQQGGAVADVWVVGNKPVAGESMLLYPASGVVRQKPGILPSRAAENLFWMGRYIERAENAIRMLRVYHLRLAEANSPDSPLLTLVADIMKDSGIDPRRQDFPKELQVILNSASNAGAHVRDRFSPDGWMALKDLDKTVASMMKTARPGADMAHAMGVLLRKISGFSGLVHENMYRFTGWRFLGIGRSLERAYFLCGLLAAMTDESAPEGSLDLVVEVADSVMSYRRRYAVATSREMVLDLLTLDPLNPRAILYQLNEIEEHVKYLPNTEFHQQLSPLQRTLLQSKAALAVNTPEMLTSEILYDIQTKVASLSGHLSTAYLR